MLVKQHADDARWMQGDKENGSHADHLKGQQLKGVGGNRRKGARRPVAMVNTVSETVRPFAVHPAVRPVETKITDDEERNGRANGISPAVIGDIKVEHAKATGDHVVIKDSADDREHDHIECAEFALFLRQAFGRPTIGLHLPGLRLIFALLVVEPIKKQTRDPINGKSTTNGDGTAFEQQKPIHRKSPKAGEEPHLLEHVLVKVLSAFLGCSFRVILDTWGP